MSDSEESVFNFDIDEGDTSLPRPEKTRKKQRERASAWTFQDTWQCSYATVGAATVENRRTNAIQEFKRRIICLMGELLPKVHFISIVLDCEFLKRWPRLKPQLLRRALGPPGRNSQKSLYYLGEHTKLYSSFSRYPGTSTGDSAF